MKIRNKQLAVLLLFGLLMGDRVRAEDSEIPLKGLIFPSRSDRYGIWSGPGAEKLFGDTKIKLEFYPNGNNQKLKQYMAAGTLPDFIGLDKSQAELLKNTDLLLNLDDYQEELPAVFGTKAYEEALSYCRRSFGDEEGRLYLLPVEVGERGNEAWYWMPMLQWKPYEQAGCPKLDTLEDYLDAAEAMLRYKSITPVGEPVYGFSLFGERDSFTVQEAGALAYLYGRDCGLICPLIELDARTGELRSVTDDEGFYKRALLFYFEANQRGLLDPDSRTQTYDGLKQKYDSGRVMFANYSWIVEDYNQAEKEKGFDANVYVPVTASDMKIYKEPDAFMGTDLYFGVTLNAVDAKKACGLLNWLYEPENISYLYSSPEILEPFESLGLSRAWAGIETEPLMYRERTEEDYIEEQTMESYLEENGMIQEGSGAVYLLPASSSRIQSICGDIGEIVREGSWDMIYAKDEEHFDRLWEKMKLESQRLGMDQVEEYYRDIWAKALLEEKTYGKQNP